MIGSYLSLLRRRYRVILALTVLLAPPAFLVLMAPSTGYQSTAVVQTGSPLAADVLGVNTSWEDPDSRLATEIELFDSEPVTTRAVALLEAQGWSADPATLQEQVTAAPRGASSLIDVVGEDTDPARAQQLADAFANAYVQYRQSYAGDSLRQILTELEAQLADAEAALNATDPAPTTPAAQRERNTVVSRYENAARLVEDARLRLSVDTSGVTLLAAATPAERVSGLNPVVAGTLATLAALAAGLGVAVLLDLVRDPVRTRNEAQELLGAPVLAEVPRAGAGDRAAALADGASPVLAAARGLRLRLSALGDGRSPSTVLVTGSARDADDTLLVGSALAASCARAGATVVLVADPRSGTADLPATRGAGEPVTATPTLTARPTALQGIWTVPATGGADDSAGLLDAASPARELERLRQAFDVVVLVEPPTGALDAAAVSSLLDATLVVCAVGRTPARHLRALMATMDDFGGTVDGVVVTTDAPALAQQRPAPRATADSDDLELFRGASAEQGAARTADPVPTPHR